MRQRPFTPARPRAVICDFLETRASSLHTLKANIGLLRYKPKTRVFKLDAVPFAARRSEGAYDIAFADPPHGSRMLDHVIKSWEATRFALASLQTL